MYLEKYAGYGPASPPLKHQLCRRQHFPQADKGADLAYARQEQQLFGVQFIEALVVFGADHQDVIELAGDHVALHTAADFLHRRFKIFKTFRGGTVEHHAD